MSYNTKYNIQPDPSGFHNWDDYSRQIDIEYRQSIEEGLDIEKYKPLFDVAQSLDFDQYKLELTNILYNIVKNAETRADYKYNEPSSLEEIKALRKPYSFKANIPASKEAFSEKISGAWYGRICGCLLGKGVEGIKVREFWPFLKETGNYPMHRYIYKSDITEEIQAKYEYNFMGSRFADEITCAPIDDDTNYTVMAMKLISKYGKDFTPKDVIECWIERQYKNSYCTAERLAYINYIQGYLPPASAVYKNPYREWIGAQIRGDYFGYINPGNPELAAEMAFRDACISHVKNGIYGEMFVAAMIAIAAVNDNIKDIILGALAEIPATSRLYEAIMRLVERYDAGVTKEEAFADIHAEWNDEDAHDWCHTISNALIVVASLLYGEGDYSKSICMSVETGFDTDCNGATVGSVLGMRGGESAIDEYWKKPLNGTLETTIRWANKMPIESLVKSTLSHLPEDLF